MKNNPIKHQALRLGMLCLMRISTAATNCMKTCTPNSTRLNMEVSYEKCIFVFTVLCLGMLCYCLVFTTGLCPIYSRRRSNASNL